MTSVFIPQRRHHLRELELVRDLEEFEGPILSEYKARVGGGTYLQKWCAREEGRTTNLIVRSDLRAIAEYLSGRTAMRDLLTGPSDGVGFLVDSIRGEIVETRLVVLEEVSGLLPEPHVIHDESLRPEWDMVPQSYLLPENWEASRISELERNLVSAAAFGFLSKPGSKDLIPPSLLDGVMNGGYSIANAFRSVRAALPKGRRPKSSSISLNSPGVLVIETPVEMFEVLEGALLSLEGARDAYHAVHQWSRFNSRAAEHVPMGALSDLRSLCDRLHVDVEKVLPRDGLTGILGPNYASRDAILVAGKLVAAYFRMLWRVAQPVGDIEFTGIRVASSGLEYQADEDIFEESA